MPQTTKIATCNYCGTRAALVLSGSIIRHELACATCGAPLHELKSLPQAKTTKAEVRVRGSEAPVYGATHMQKTKKTKKKSASKKKRKSWTRRALSEVWDVVEDIFD